jgi:hypothetical protein
MGNRAVNARQKQARERRRGNLEPIQSAAPNTAESNLNPVEGKGTSHEVMGKGKKSAVQCEEHAKPPTVTHGTHGRRRPVASGRITSCT